ncbi:hypothetical protein FO519_006331 [Halicephalobus sp. NKZ332]|nr:hypothetical protein FO519_006331 [Halicephalobus sp. NKZ332]
MPPHRPSPKNYPTTSLPNASQVQVPSQRVEMAPVQQPGHHREILDKIRDSLRPFEQSYEVQMFGNPNPSTSFSPNSFGNPIISAEKSDDTQMNMISTLTQLGFDKESAYYALKLVNFRSIGDAANVLNKIKQDIALKQMNNGQPGPSNITTTTFYTSPARQPTTSAQRLPRYTTVASPVSSSSSRQQSSQGTYLNVSKSQTPDDSRGSSRSESPNAPRYSPTTNWSRITISQPQNVPKRPDYHSSHAKISLKHTTSVDPHNFVRTPGIAPNRSLVTSMTSAPPSSTVITIERDTAPQQQPPRRTNMESVPVIRTRVDRPSASQYGVDPRRVQVSSIYSRNVLEKPPQTAIQSIIVDPDKVSGPLTATTLVNYVDQICLKTSLLGRERDSVLSSEHITGNISPVISSGFTSPAMMDEPRSPEIHKRSSSPLPESVNRKLKNSTYERFVKPCKPGMYQFFMEQHIDSVVRQYQDRNQRALQLLAEMDAAKLAETLQEQMLKLLRQKESKYIRLRRQKMNKHMFDIIKRIGVGAFGKVALVRKKDTNQIYAMKILSKEDVIQKQQAAHVKAERDILAEANSPWIVKLYFSFQDSRNLYFIMEYVPGGDMMQLLILKGVFKESLARFYIAELTCAIEYVHSLGFIHRDIKPDNILIDKKGHIKRYVIYEDGDPNAISHFRDDSFSLPPEAQENGKLKLLEYRHHKRRYKAHSVVGTGNYMAPEVLKRSGHTQLCDWWSVGVILYEMVFGRPPFMSYNDNPLETQYKITNWERFLDLTCMSHLPAPLSDNCIDMIARLCCEQNERIGAKNGAAEIKLHPWFAGIEFENLRETKAEHIPHVKGADDTSNFDTSDFDKDIDLFKMETLKSHHNVNPAFFDFTFRHFFDFEPGQPAQMGRAQHRPSLAPLIEANAKQIANGNQTPEIKENSSSTSSQKTERDRKKEQLSETIRKEPPLPAKPFPRILPSQSKGFDRNIPVFVRQQQRGPLKRDLFRQHHEPVSKTDDDKYQQRL